MPGLIDRRVHRWVADNGDIVHMTQEANGWIGAHFANNGKHSIYRNEAGYTSDEVMSAITLDHLFDFSKADYSV